MTISVTATISPATITLGNTVTLTWSCTGAQDTQITADNLSSPIDLGPGDSSGTMKFLPVVSGSFNVYVTGNGNAGMGSESTAAVTQQVTCSVS